MNDKRFDSSSDPSWAAEIRTLEKEEKREKKNPISFFPIPSSTSAQMLVYISVKFLT